MPGSTQPVDPLAREQLAARAVALDRALAAAARDLGRARAQLVDERLHPRAPPLELVRALDVRFEQRHAESLRRRCVGSAPCASSSTRCRRSRSFAAPRSRTRTSCSRPPTATASPPSPPRPRSRRATGIVVLPDVRGLYRFYEELALRFAERGYAAIAIDYFGRTAGVGKRDDDFPYTEHVAQTTQDGHPGRRRARPSRTCATDGAEAVFTVGFCFGGRNSWLAAAGGHGLAGAVGFYGRPGERQRPARPDRSSRARSTAPILALQAGDDANITPGAERGVRRGALSRGRRARARRLRRRAAQLLRPPLRGVRRGVGGRLAARARVRRAARCLSSGGPPGATSTGSRMISAPPVSIGWYSYEKMCLSVSLSIVAASARSSASGSGGVVERQRLARAAA